MYSGDKGGQMMEEEKVTTEKETENTSFKQTDDCCCHESCQCEQGDMHKEKGSKGKALKKLEARNKELEELNKDLENKLLVSKADFINYRKRKDEEASRMLKYAGESMIKDMLSTIDNFERAIALDDENLDDELSKFLDGFKMIYCNFVNVLEKYEIKAIDGSDKAFDPAYHQAVMTSKVEGMDPGMVIEVLQKGYLYKDRVIRPAMVRVSE